MRWFISLPSDLPVPNDDGACKHLEGKSLPDLDLQTTLNRFANLRVLTKKSTVFFLYPRSGRPDEEILSGWDEIPGARGCTPQACGYRDRFQEFRALGVEIFGISTQTTEFQKEFAKRMNLPYEILSDAEFNLTNALKLPTFLFNSTRLLKRAAWFCEDGRIQKIFYPVFPPDKNAETVLSWIKLNK